MILVKIHLAGINGVVCFCDANLINKRFGQGNRQLNIPERFYNGEVMQQDKMLSLMQTSRNLNITGKKSIAFAIKHHIIKKEYVISIQGIPHAQVVR